MYFFTKNTNPDYTYAVDQQLRNYPDLTKKLISKNLAFKINNKIYLTKQGILAKKIGFVRYFELEKLEKKILTSNYRRECKFMSIIIYILMCIILFLGYLTITKFENSY